MLPGEPPVLPGSDSPPTPQLSSTRVLMDDSGEGRVVLQRGGGAQLARCLAPSLSTCEWGVIAR